MKVLFEQSGGWGNPLGRICKIETDELDAKTSEQLAKLVKAAKLGSIASSVSPLGRDMIQYRIEIEDGAKTTTATFDDTGMTEAARPLIEFLQSRARPRTKND
jgi:hypothetical protein